MGKTWSNDYVFDINDVMISLNCCDVIIYGQYYFDSDEVDPSVMEYDKSNLKRVELNVCVFILYN